MKVHHAVAALLVAQCVTGAASAAEQFQISPQLGTSTLSLDAGSLKSGQPVEQDAALGGVQLRYVTPIGFLGEIGASSLQNTRWHDRHDELRLTQYAFAIGWQFETPLGFRITPKVGRARWDLYSRDGLLTQTQPGTNTRRGSDNYWELNLEKEINPYIALGLSYKDNPYEFGNVRSVAFTASFAL